MVHGDLKGVWLRTLVVIPPHNTVFIKANILIDRDGHARLADFGLLTIIPDSTNPMTSTTCMNVGTTKWMSPELLDPDRFDFKDGRPTKESDCYALGMVVLEVLTGEVPFARYTSLTVMRKVVDGERPERPQGPEATWFTDDLWGTLEQCWSPQPKTRPTIEAVLECLQRGSVFWQPLPQSVDHNFEVESDDESLLTTCYNPCVFLYLAPDLYSPPFPLCSRENYHTGRYPTPSF